MKKMSAHPRLYRRGSVYYHRAAIPVDIKDTYPKTEETFSLKTSDYQEAVRRVRVAAAEVDQRFDLHRRQMAQSQQPPATELPPEQIKHIGEVYYAYLLEEDEETRLTGFSELPRQTHVVSNPQEVAVALQEHGFQPPTFEERVQTDEWLDGVHRNAQARGKVDPFFLGEAEEVLSWDTVNIRLDHDSPAFMAVARALQAASIRAAKAKQERDQGEIVETPAVTQPVPIAGAAPLLSTTVDEWAREKANTTWVPKTEREHRVWVAHFIALVGDRPLNTYTKADARAFKALLMRLPPNWSKHSALKGLPINRAAERAEALGLKPMSHKNINKLLGFVGSFWIWAANAYEDSVSGNIFRGLKLTLRNDVREERDPFTIEELQKIFSVPLFTGCQSLHHYRRPGTLVPKDAGRYWVPLISLFSGARLGEVCQLYVSDIKDESGVLYFDLNKGAEDKRLKNKNAKRRIPVHPTLLNIGFMKLVETRRQQGEKRLFPDLPIGADGYYSSPFSKWFKRFLESAGVKRGENAFHSFRHSFEDACRDSDIPKEIMDALQGHGEEGMARRYGDGYTGSVLLLRKLDEAMGRLQYRGLDLSHLFVG
jgi:integrase